jgi:peptidoglycan hydrolase-like protein with peptidoglycan-binding domain
MNTTSRFSKAPDLAALTGPVLYPWDSGIAVAQLQQLLQAHGFDLKIDGDFGWMTEAAVKAFQRQAGLKINGVVDEQTWAALKRSVQPGSRLLSLGHTGADVYELQGLLQVHGYNIRRDGIFDSETRQAVILFQKRHKLKDNGMVDRITWTMLRGRGPLPMPAKQTGWYFNPRRWW